MIQPSDSFYRVILDRISSELGINEKEILQKVRSDFELSLQKAKEEFESKLAGVIAKVSIELMEMVSFERIGSDLVIKIKNQLAKEKQ